MLLVWQPLPAWSQDQDPFDSSAANRILDSIELQFAITSLHDRDWLDQVFRQVTQQRSAIQRCIDTGEQNLAGKRTAIGQELIDQLSSQEARTPQEEVLARELATLDHTITECKLLLGRSGELLAQITAIEADFYRTQRNRKESSIFHNLVEGITAIGPYLDGRVSGVVQVYQASALGPYSGMVLILLVAGVLAGLVIGRRLRVRWGRGMNAYSSDMAIGFRLLVLHSPVLMTPIILLQGALWILEGFAWLGTAFGQILWLLLGYLVALAFLPVLIEQANRYTKSRLAQGVPARELDIRLALIVTLLGVWILEIAILEPDPVHHTTGLLVSNLLSSVVILGLLEFAFFLNRVPGITRVGNLVRIISISLLVLSLVLEWIGYLVLSRFLWEGLLLTGLLLSGYYLAEHLLRSFFQGLDSSQFHWQARFRKWLSVHEGEQVPGLIWLRLSCVIILWVSVLLAFMRVWGVSDSTMASLYSIARDGLRLGDTRIVPVNVLIGILVFTVLLAGVRWVRDKLDRGYLQQSKMDGGAREALVTILGYVGFTIAALTGLSFAGVDLSNIALVAGALSVGIGFGLQNIVNNFVSGMILLFERPIRTGDWIVTGSTEGIVKKISVRSTEVQTFDRADVIVPNSDLISTPVTNWTLQDRHGRISIPVGVAYGSDTEQVKHLLEESAREIPELVHDNPDLPTRVFFLSFGDSTLDFQLRCYVHDVWDILNATSQLHFIIDRKFREHGIVIAFPQRDIHIASGLPLPTPSD